MEMIKLFLYFVGITSIAQGDFRLLYSNRRSIEIVDVDNDNPNDTSIVKAYMNDAVAVDFMFKEGYIFWTYTNLKEIHGAYISDIENTTTIIVSTRLGSPHGLACDWIGKKLYWTDSDTKRIEVTNFDGSFRKVLYSQGLDQPRAIVLDPKNGYMYWTDWGDVPKIERAGMDGSLGTRTVIVDDNIYWPNGLTIDYEEEKLYWVDAKKGYIHNCNLDGSHRNVIIKSDLNHPFAITLFGDYLYWTDWQTNSIHTCNKHTGMEQRKVLTDIDQPMDIQAFDARRQMDGENPCGDNNGGCSHLCLISPIQPRYKCTCPTGIDLLNDQKTCDDDPDEILLLARRTDLCRISLNDAHYTDVVIQTDDIQHAIAIDYDPVEGHVYWTDEVTHTISRVFLNGTDHEVLVETNIVQPDGIAVDWIGRNLYWTDTGTDRIEVARLNGASRKILISDNLDEPRALCLAPEEGRMWWTDWGKNPKIETAYLDGTNRKVIVNSDLGWPNGLAVESKEKKIYWCDAKTDRIEVINMDGTERRVLVKDGIPHAFGLSLLGEYIYWTDWLMRSVYRADKATGGNRTVILNDFSNLMGLKATKVRNVRGENVCKGNNGNCSHLCLALPDSENDTDRHRCACPTYYKLDSNNHTCSPLDFILFSRESEMSRLYIDVSTTHATSRFDLPIQNISSLKSIGYDMEKGQVYWISEKSMSIKRSNPDGSDIEDVVNIQGTSPYDFAIDPYSRTLFYSCSENNVINFTHIDSDTSGTVVQGNWKPRYLAIYPEKGFLFWTTEDIISRTLFDGTEHLDIFQSKSSSLGPITVDPKTKMLYWVDLEDHVIECGDFNGGNRQLIFSGEGDNNIRAVAGMTVLGNYLYWVDQDKQFIGRVNKATGEDFENVVNNVTDLSDIQAVTYIDPAQINKHPCTENNGNCSHLCFTKTFSLSECSCPSSMVLANDGLSCAEKTRCYPYQFVCKTGNILCIPKQWQCDGSPDCADNSDEEECNVCAISEFMCKDRTCIPDIQVCDGKFQCITGEDEEGCCTKETEIKCTDLSKCYEKEGRCDGKYDCDDRSDEEGCEDKESSGPPSKQDDRDQTFSWVCTRWETNMDKSETRTKRSILSNAIFLRNENDATKKPSVESEVKNDYTMPSFLKQNINGHIISWQCTRWEMITLVTDPDENEASLDVQDKF